MLHPCISILCTQTKEVFSYIIALEGELGWLGIEQSPVLLNELLRLSIAVVNVVCEAGVQVCVVEVLYLDGLEGADFCRSVKYNVEFIVDCKVEVSDRIVDECFAL